MPSYDLARSYLCGLNKNQTSYHQQIPQNGVTVNVSSGNWHIKHRKLRGVQLLWNIISGHMSFSQHTHTGLTRYITIKKWEVTLFQSKLDMLFHHSYETSFVYTLMSSRLFKTKQDHLTPAFSYETLIFAIFQLSHISLSPYKVSVVSYNQRYWLNRREDGPVWLLQSNLVLLLFFLTWIFCSVTF